MRERPRPPQGEKRPVLRRSRVRLKNYFPPKLRAIFARGFFIFVVPTPLDKISFPRHPAAMAMESDSPLDSLWQEYGRTFRDWDDLTLARWLAQTLGQFEGRAWRLSHPLVGAYRLPPHNQGAAPAGGQGGAPPPPPPVSGVPPRGWAPGGPYSGNFATKPGALWGTSPPSCGSRWWHG